MDTLSINGLKTSCRIGTTEQEQRHPQEVMIDLEIAINAAAAAKTDDVRDAVDYAAIVGDVKELAEEAPFTLMETLAEEIASMLLEEFGTDGVRVRVSKKALAEIDSASVEIERER
mgnify:CR=1 FL=1